MKNITDKIIDYLRRNRVSTTEVADALGKRGAIENIVPINPKFHKVGKTKWVYACDGSNYTIHEQIQNVDDGIVLIVSAFNCSDRALFGELVSKYLILYRQCEAVVCIGKLRDAAMLIKNNYPIWGQGFNPIGCYNEEPKRLPDKKILDSVREKYDNGIAICDDCGVVVISEKDINEEILERIISIENQEDEWFDLLDRVKKNTFEIVCKGERDSTNA